MDDQENEPIAYELCAVSRLPLAEASDVVGDSLLYVSVPGDDPDYQSKKLRYGDLESKISAGFGLDRLKLSVEVLSGAIAGERHTLSIATDEPWIISSIVEDHGNIVEVSGYRLSTAVGNTLQNNLWFKSNESENAEPIGSIIFGKKDEHGEPAGVIMSVELSAHALEPLVKLRVWPGAWKV